MKIIITLLSLLICNVALSEELHVGDKILTRHTDYGNYFEENSVAYGVVKGKNEICYHQVYFEHACKDPTWWFSEKTVKNNNEDLIYVLSGLVHAGMREYGDMRSYVCPQNLGPKCGSYTDHQMAEIRMHTVREMDNIFGVMP